MRRTRISFLQFYDEGNNIFFFSQKFQIENEQLVCASKFRILKRFGRLFNELLKMYSQRSGIWYESIPCASMCLYRSSWLWWVVCVRNCVCVCLLPLHVYAATRVSCMCLCMSGVRALLCDERRANAVLFVFFIRVARVRERREFACSHRGIALRLRLLIVDSVSYLFNDSQAGLSNLRNVLPPVRWNVDFYCNCQSLQCGFGQPKIHWSDFMW